MTGSYPLIGDKKTIDGHECVWTGTYWRFTRLPMETFRAKTMIELKAKLRRALGWPDRRSWTDAERQELAARYTLRADHKRGDFVAEPKQL